MQFVSKSVLISYRSIFFISCTLYNPDILQCLSSYPIKRMSQLQYTKPWINPVQTCCKLHLRATCLLYFIYSDTHIFYISRKYSPIQLPIQSQFAHFTKSAGYVPSIFHTCRRKYCKSNEIMVCFNGCPEMLKFYIYYISEHQHEQYCQMCTNIGCTTPRSVRLYLFSTQHNSEDLISWVKFLHNGKTLLLLAPIRVQTSNMLSNIRMHAHPLQNPAICMLWEAK